MKKLVLNNGLKVIIDSKPTKSVAIEVSVTCGSNNEQKKNAGISHFIEHLVFDGTKKRPNAQAISNEIEKLGGELNAMTSNERTVYYIKVLNKHFEIGLDILADIVLNPLFKDEDIEKERKVIIDEINMINDDPRHLQWILFQKNLFEKHPTKNPVYGRVESIQKITRDDIIEYYNRYYTTNNISLIIVGDVDNSLKKISKYFCEYRKKKLPVEKLIFEPKQNQRIVKRIRKSTIQAYMVLGYKTVSRKHIDSYSLDVIRAILGRGQSGKVFDTIRTKYALAYDVGAYHRIGKDFAYFSVYVCTQSKNINRVIELIMQEFENLSQITHEEIQEAKTHIEGSFVLQNEDNQKLAENYAFWEYADDANHLKNYIKKVKSIKKEDVIRVAKKFLTRDYTVVIIE